MTLAAGSLFWQPKAQAAAAQMPVAIGVVNTDDTRVLGVGGDGTSNQSPVEIVEYLPGVRGGDIDRQRWSLVRVFDVYDFTYRVEHVASGRCLTASGEDNGAPVVLADCSDSSLQLWAMPPESNPDGLAMWNVASSRCLDIPDFSTGTGVAMQLWDCAYVWSQSWQRRTGAFDCGTRDSEWIHTDLCVRAEEDVHGVVAAWANTPVALKRLNPAQWVLSNTVQNSVSFARADGSGGVEYGWRADHNGQVGAAVTYNLYWSEWNAGQYTYSVVPSWIAPGSSDPDGMPHSYLVLPSGSGDQYDLYYDYNPLTSTRLQTGGPVRDVRTGLAIRYLRAATINTPFANELQLATGDTGTRYPFVREVATGEPKTCDAPPTWDDFGYGVASPTGADAANMKPWCFTVAVGTSGASSGDGTAVDSLVVGKPSAAATIAASPTAAPASTVNGVDQRALADCMRRTGASCLSTVPGLAACVEAKQVCHAGPTVTSHPKVPGTSALSLDQARREALRVMATGSGGARATSDLTRLRAQTVPAASLPAVAGIGVDQVHIVSGDGPAEPFTTSAAATYAGFTVIFDATTGALLHVCLGSRCAQ
ncbi:RICIN domain-containing protein [Dactylosporangium sp. NPDC049525]|uniref:RICIN domain-containing protein n=1 Tax=Dactylosporangium sp. NPDC049525 TaxID=3154730 RepID=UPI00342F9D6C